MKNLHYIIALNFSIFTLFSVFKVFTSTRAQGGVLGSFPEIIVHNTERTLQPIKNSIMPTDAQSFIHTDPGVTSYIARTPAASKE